MRWWADESCRPMIPTSRTSRTALVALALLAGCGPLVQVGGNAPAPAALLTLRATAPASPDQPRGSATLAIPTPVVPGALQTLRVPVTTRDTEIAYLKDASWVEQPNRLFLRLLADVVTAKTGIVVLEGRQLDTPPQRQLAGQLLEFGLDVRDPTKPQVVVRFDATLTSRDGKFLGSRRFDAARPVGAQTPAAVGNALNAAANEVAGDVAAWVGQ